MFFYKVISGFQGQTNQKHMKRIEFLEKSNSLDPTAEPEFVNF